MVMVQIIRQRVIERGTTYDLCFDWVVRGRRMDGGFSFPCDKDGNVAIMELRPEGLENFHLCATGQMKDYQGNTVSTPYVRPMRYCHIIPAAARCDACGGEAEMHPHCGAWVCHQCGNHLTLARCFCGWSASGRDGYKELIDLGETIDPEE